MMDRRDLLKRFGIGAIIVPVVGGAAITSHAATLIEVPKVKPVELFASIPKELNLEDVARVTITFTMKDATERIITIDRPALRGTIKPTDDLFVDVILTAQNRYSSPELKTKLGRFQGEALLG
jgi:hypothetical protein